MASLHLCRCCEVAVIALNGADVQKLNVPWEGSWMLRGDRSLTYAKKILENSTFPKGTWWPADYTGNPLVFFSAQEVAELGLKFGDMVTVEILGYNVTAKTSISTKFSGNRPASTVSGCFRPTHSLAPRAAGSPC